MGVLPVKCAIMQPTFFPWLGYFRLITESDLFIFLDDAQLSKQSWQTKNRIKTKNGELYISVPIFHNKHYKEQTIKDTVICDYNKWSLRTLKTLQQSYGKAKHFQEPFGFLVNYFQSYTQQDSVTLGEFNSNLIVSLSVAMGITSHKFFNLSTCITKTEHNKTPRLVSGEKDSRLVSICRAFECTEYLSPQGSSAYLETEQPGGAFNGSGIPLYYQNYEHPTYEQVNGPFVPYMGIVDLIFNVGFSNALSVINSGGKSSYSVEDFRKLKGLC